MFTCGAATCVEFVDGRVRKLHVDDRGKHSCSDDRK